MEEDVDKDNATNKLLPQKEHIEGDDRQNPVKSLVNKLSRKPLMDYKLASRPPIWKSTRTYSPFLGKVISDKSPKKPVFSTALKSYPKRRPYPQKLLFEKYSYSKTSGKQKLNEGTEVPTPSPGSHEYALPYLDNNLEGQRNVQDVVKYEPHDIELGSEASLYIEKRVNNPYLGNFIHTIHGLSNNKRTQDVTINTNNLKSGGTMEAIEKVNTLLDDQTEGVRSAETSKGSNNSSQGHNSLHNSIKSCPPDVENATNAIKFPTVPSRCVPSASSSRSRSHRKHSRRRECEPHVALFSRMSLEAKYAIATAKKNQDNCRRDLNDLDSVGNTEGQQIVENKDDTGNNFADDNHSTSKPMSIIMRRNTPASTLELKDNEPVRSRAISQSRDVLRESYPSARTWTRKTLLPSIGSGSRYNSMEELRDVGGMSQRNIPGVGQFMMAIGSRENSFQITPIGYDSRYAETQLQELKQRENSATEFDAGMTKIAHKKCNEWLKKYH
ncbi:unnamed protein product [Owenia fusiformis]|uniref:Uncharacterized protein n=1 Tax=Owenia fusiformis TaxID=6347 RepID=A0A8J1UIJ5_OWEFU|nr:unnamed protein product [Owenia fusiformis]